MNTKNTMEPIAIVGIGCRFPGAPNPGMFWRLLREGIDAVSDVPKERWDADDLYDPDPLRPGKTVSRQGGFIKNVDKFDWRAFRIPPREAKYMDPQHRLLLEVAWEALEDAGLPPEKVAGSRTSVFIGIVWNDYLRLQSSNQSQLNGYLATGNCFAFAPNRISYIFDLKGPSVAIDAACASSLASVHYACQSLWMGEATMALAGGVNLLLSPDLFIMLSKAGVLSPEGRCKTLDAMADGFVRGEGAGIVVLKPFSQLTPSDRVYAFIRGSAINHNGHNEWIMAANPEAQEMVIRDAYSKSGINPAEIDYVELHGTGLLKGDALEAKVLGKVLGHHNARNHPCSIGSVKTNIGHLESAAGIAGIIKVALSLYYRQIPPTLNFQKINPNVNLESLGLVVQEKLGSWPNKSGQNLAGVTAIAMSGLNAHIVMQGPPWYSEESIGTKKHSTTRPRLLTLSARSPDALSALVKAFIEFLADEETGARFSLEDICFTASVHRAHHECRLSLLGISRMEFIERLEAYSQGRFQTGVFCKTKVIDDDTVQDGFRYNGVSEKVISECLEHRDQGGAISIFLPPEEKEVGAVLEALCALYVRGYTVDWRTLYPSGERIVQLPPYPWQRERLWPEWMDGQTRCNDTYHKIMFNKQVFDIAHQFLHKLKESQPQYRRSLLVDHVRAQVVSILGLDPAFPLNLQQGLFEAGLNSLGTVELVNRLQNSLGKPLSPSLIFDYPTIESLSDYLAREVLSLDYYETCCPKPQKENDNRRSVVLSRLGALSEDDAMALLRQKLDSIEEDTK